MAETLVINASPLIFLANADRLELLRSSGAVRFVVPPAVLEEVTVTQHTDAAAGRIAEAKWIERAPDVSVPADVIEWDLGPGESAVIATCLHFGAEARPVLDDLAGRRCARAFGLRVIGTIGIVIAAQRAGHVEDARNVLVELRAAGMWVSDAVIDEALRLAALDQ